MFKKQIQLLCFFAFLFVPIALGANKPSEKEFYVAINGKDTNSGTKKKPFATITRARDAVRDLKKNGLSKNIVVNINSGSYFLTEPLNFTVEDSGTDKFSITYKAYKGENPVLSGGKTITGWKKGEGNIWTAELPEVKEGKWQFRQLFVNGKRAVRARTPNDGYSRVENSGPDRRTSFTFKKGDIKSYKNLDRTEIVFLHDWSVSRIRIENVDEAKNVVKMTAPIGCSMAEFMNITGFEAHPRYFVENALELLDSPGEWYLDNKTGKLSYWPLPGEDLSRDEVVAPVLSSLLNVTGEAGKGARVENLTFSGLTFSHCEFTLPELGYAEIQAGVYETRPNPEKKWSNTRSNPAAIVFNNTNNCSLEKCNVSHVDTSGVRLDGQSEGNSFVACRLFDIGGNGFMIGSQEDKPEKLSKNNIVTNNYVHDCGVIGFGCVGVWVGITDGTQISHNEISDLPYSGVSVGWNWSTKPTQCRGNIVEYNHIHHVMQKLSDGGGIYTLGRQPGTVLRGNLIHDIPLNAGRAESNGMFLDEGSSEFVVEDNTIYAIAKATIRFHKATGLTVRKNFLFTPSGKGEFTFNSCAATSMKFEANEVLPLQKTYVRTDDKAPENSKVESIEKAWSFAGLESAYKYLLNSSLAEKKK